MSEFKTLFREALIKYVGVKTFEHYNDPAWGVDIILRNSRNGMPIGAYVLSTEVPQFFRPEWARLQGALIECPIFAVNHKRLIATGEIEAVELSNVKNPEFKPVQPLVVKNVPQEVTGASVTPEPASPGTTFPVTLKLWENGSLRRFYVNGNGWGAERDKNLASLFSKPLLPDTRVWVENGAVKAKPQQELVLVPGAIEYLLANTQ